MSQNHRRDAPAINPTKNWSLFEVPFWDIPPLEAGAQDVHHAVYDGSHVRPPLTAAALAGGISGSTYAHSSSVKSLGYLK
jgi:hypothetical protein